MSVYTPCAMKRWIVFCLWIALYQWPATAQKIQERLQDSLVVSNEAVKVIVNHTTGTVNYLFANGVSLYNTIAYINDIRAGYLATPAYSSHRCTTQRTKDDNGDCVYITITHQDEKLPFVLLQRIIVYAQQPHLITYVEVSNKDKQGYQPETRDISPLAILPASQGRLVMPGHEPRILDVPFDNDNWVNVLARKWPVANTTRGEGISYELGAVYDNATLSGFVAGSVVHDFWKTGFAYRTGAAPGELDSLNIYGGAATEDDPKLPPAYGGLDGTHDHTLHGTMTGSAVTSPIVFLSATSDVRKDLVRYGQVNVQLAGNKKWKGYAPFYWNSFGVEGVLGYSHVMMPDGVTKTSEFIQSLDNFNRYGQPVLSVDSYDQNIYTTSQLASLGKEAAKKKQQMGFYCSPFSVWTWKNSLDNPIPGTDYPLKNVVLRDKNLQPIPYKNGEWACYPLDPTHPATRQYMIGQLQKAKAIHATFIKIDFLSAGSLESLTRYDPAVRSGIQAYNLGLKLFSQLVDSIMGPDVFISMAISPMFPHQYAHTRFISTDVYSHLRDDQAGFPNWGSTEASLANGSHLWWVQGTLWPYSNLDVSIMKSFQKNPDLTEQEIKVRLYAMMVMGSVLGDGSDYRNKLAADRARYFLNNASICAFFSQPQAFTPLNFADGESFDQQLAFSLQGDTTMLGLFNFHLTRTYQPGFSRKTLGLAPGSYEIRDFMTGSVLGTIAKGQASFTLTVPVKDALMVKLVPAAGR